MNVHKHVRMTSHGRLLLVQRIRLQGWRVAEAAAASGVSVRTAYKWVARHRTGGEPVLHDRRSTPGRSPRRTPAEIVGAIDRLRRQRLSGPRIARSRKRPQRRLLLLTRRHRRVACHVRPPRIIRWPPKGNLL
ncbi:MAG: leucine zipper domain-containing protein [Rhodoplanes sp.]